MTTKSDSLRRFLFENTEVRGELVHLDATFRSALERASYPPAVQRLLGEMLVVSALLAATIKFRGSLILQVQGNALVSLLVAQCTHEGKIRGLAKHHDEVPDDADFAALLGRGNLIITMDPADPGGERYQGIVALTGDSLGDVLEHYFAQSEQLETRLWLTSNEYSAAGMLLQRMPTETPGHTLPDEDAWNRITHLGATIKDPELLDLPSEQIIRRLFHEEDVRIFETVPLAFRCDCSRERIERLLQAMGHDDAKAAIEEQGRIEVGCEFCNKKYYFDPVDIDALFAETAQRAPENRTLQ